MKLNPKWKWVIGRMVDVTSSSGGLELPSTRTAGASAYMLIDAVGPEAESCKVGDIAIFIKVQHFETRDGERFTMAIDEATNSCADVEDLDVRRTSITGSQSQPQA